MTHELQTNLESLNDSVAAAILNLMRKGEKKVAVSFSSETKKLWRYIKNDSNSVEREEIESFLSSKFESL